MTQQIDHPVHAYPVDARHTGPTVPEPRPAPETAHPPTWSGAPAAMPGWPPAMPPAPPAPARRSTGATVALLAAAGTAGLLVVLLVIAIVIGALGRATPPPAVSAPPVSAPPVSAPATPGSPTADPAVSRTATQRGFDAAGVRLDRARGVFDQQLAAASKAGDIAGVRAAARTFRAELEVYRATVTSLAMPADQQPAFAGTLVPALDATIADAAAIERASGVPALKAAATAFDQHWGQVVSTHNQMDHALLAG